MRCEFKHAAIFRERPASVFQFSRHRNYVFPGFAFSPSSTAYLIKACDAWQSFSMEASVCLPCDVPQKWSGLEPWQ
jgi:hypothetical protein